MHQCSDLILLGHFLLLSHYQTTFLYPLELHVSLSGSLLTSGSHILISDVGLNIDNGLKCWINSRVTGDTLFKWYHKLQENQTHEFEVIGEMIYRGWFNFSWLNVFPFKILARILGTEAVEGIFTCRHRNCGSCLVSVNIHYPGKSIIICITEWCWSIKF